MFQQRASILNVSNSDFYLPMKPLTNLKSFLAVVLILIVSSSLLIASFRNHVPGAGGHEQSDVPHSTGSRIHTEPENRETMTTTRPNPVTGSHE